ncbi:MAG: cupredoxin domain-containing protein [Vicinamibacterales bacterium]
MSIWGRTVSKTTVAAVAALFVAVVGLLPVMTLPFSSPSARTVAFVAKDMAFYLESDPRTANPVIEARAGERIRVVLVNRDRGLKHAFAVPAVDAGIEELDWNEEDEVTFDVPDEAGTYEYVCRPHLLMMRGQLVVRSADE